VSVFVRTQREWDRPVSRADQTDRANMLSIAVSGMDIASLADLGCWDTIIDVDSGLVPLVLARLIFLAPGWLSLWLSEAGLEVVVDTVLGT
jgi:hypothetical protein